MVVFRLTPRSGRIRTGFLESRTTWEVTQDGSRAYGYGAITLSGQEFTPVPLAREFLTVPPGSGPEKRDPTTP